MSKFLKSATTALLSAILATGGALAANATADPYTTVVWQMPSWAGENTATWPQTIVGEVTTSTPNLAAADALLTAPCNEERYYQVDVNYNTDVIRATINGGHLYGPNNPGESLIQGGWGTAYKVVKVVGEPCPPAKPEPRPYSDAGETFTCEAWTYWTKTGFYDLALDPSTNQWIENEEPTITQETSEQWAPLPEELLARGCVSEPKPTPVPDDPSPTFPTSNPAPNETLAETGLTDDPFQFAAILFIGLTLLAGGVMLVVVQTRQTT